MRIWFNHWFSTAYHLIGLMRESGPERFTFVGSSSNPYAVYQRACDEWFAEPELPKEEYVDFCLRSAKSIVLIFLSPGGGCLKSQKTRHGSGGSGYGCLRTRTRG